MKKRVFFVLMLSLFLSAWCSGIALAGEIEMNYSGPLDDITSKPPVTNQDGEALETSTHINISSSCYYDTSSREFVYPAAGQGQLVVRSNVADGMMVDHVVNIYADEGVPLILYRNGELRSDLDPSSINVTGQYSIFLGEDADIEELFNFTIVGEVSGQVKSYSLPEGFQVIDATINGEPLGYERHYVGFLEEGEYYVKYRCNRTEEIYDLQFTADFQAPVLALPGVVDGIARGPVDISDLEAGAGISVTLDGKPIGYDEILTSSGDYVIRVADAAGNVNEYHFTILVYFDGNSWVFFAILGASAVIIISYLVVSRKTLKVR
ncbi:MAG: hypothetical protein Q4B50_06005 [Bacillota bacterium]|nr:hypothetical protein [Bacillota bacterium]